MDCHGAYYTKAYKPVNANSYSTLIDAKLHNYQMEFKTWLSQQLSELELTPTRLAKETPGLNQPTVQRILSGETQSPGLKTTEKIRAAIEIARKAKGLPPLSDFEGQSPDQQFADRVKKEVFAREVPEQYKQSILTLLTSAPEKKK